MKKIRNLIQNSSFLQSNIIMVGGSFGANIGAYLYHLSMGHMLSPTNYGILQSLISLLNLFTIPLVTLGTIVAKLTSVYIGKGNKEQLGVFYYTTHRFFWKLLILGGALFLLLLNPLQELLHVKSSASIILLDFAVFFGFIQILNRSVLQGMSKFFSFVVANVLESYGKLFLGVIVVLLGYGYEGAFGAFVLASIFTYIYTSKILRKNLPKHFSSHNAIYTILKQSPMSLIMNLSILSFFNTDVVMVRHYLTPNDAGLYAALSVLGKIIYFGAAPIANTMLPVVSALYIKKENYQKAFLQSLLLTCLFSIFVVSVFYFFPRLSLSVLVGTKYANADLYLFPFSLFIAACSLLTLFGFFYFSIHRWIPIVTMPIAALLQALLISLYHQDIMQVLQVGLTVTISLLIFHLIYYVYGCNAKISIGNHSSV